MRKRVSVSLLIAFVLFGVFMVVRWNRASARFQRILAAYRTVNNGMTRQQIVDRLGTPDNDLSFCTYLHKGPPGCVRELVYRDHSDVAGHYALIYLSSDDLVIEHQEIASP